MHSNITEVVLVLMSSYPVLTGSVAMVQNMNETTLTTQVQLIDFPKMTIWWKKDNMLQRVDEVPIRRNLVRGYAHRATLFKVNGHPKKQFRLIIRVKHANSKTNTFLDYSSIPISLTKADFDIVSKGNQLDRLYYIKDDRSVCYIPSACKAQINESMIILRLNLR